MEIGRIIIKILLWAFILGCVSDFIMKKISYSFYIKAKKMPKVTYVPKIFTISNKLSGYSFNSEKDSQQVILFFGGSGFIAYNSVGTFGGVLNRPFYAADYYGSQNSKGKMNLTTMKLSAIDLYEKVVELHPNKEIIVMGHSYGTGLATYLASKRTCHTLVLLASYCDLSDLYNKILPIFGGPGKIFLSNNIRTKDYARDVSCPSYIIGSKNDKTLGESKQYKLAGYFSSVTVKIFDQVKHEDYLKNTEVISYIESLLHLI